MQKETKRNMFVAATYAAVLLLGILLGQNYGVENRTSTDTKAILPLTNQDRFNKVQRTLDLISGNYVDSINVDSLQDLVIAEVVSRLDPHSDYMDPKTAALREQALQGSFEGIGVEYYMLRDTLLTVGVVPGGPANKAGVLVGDKLLAIDGKSVLGFNIGNQELEKMIKGKKGSAIELSILRRGIELPFPIRVIRDEYTLSSVDAAYLIETGVGYVKVSSFGAHTIEDCKSSISSLVDQGATQLILDLRGNRGGYLSAGIDLAGLFLPTGKLVVYTEGVHERRTGYAGRNGGQFINQDLVVLIDNGSASASEIVAGALQDYGRAVIIGARSYGKGLIQEKFGFEDGSLLNLTVARYITPNGRSIQRNYTNYQASDTSGIGGILPNILIAADSAQYGALYQKIVQRGLVHEFVYSRISKDVPAFAIDQYLRGYFLPKEEYSAFLKFLRDEGLQFKRADEAKIKELVKSEIEALLGKYYFGNDAYFKIKNRSDTVVFAALNYLKVKEEHESLNLF